MDDVLSRLRSAFAGRYTLERELGRGGMATVWLAQDLRHDRLVALKVVRPELAQALGPDRFLREIAVTASLDHPHILPLLDSGDAAGFLYYTMPYVQGESLRDRLSREGPLSLAETIQIASEVADALSYAHDRGVVHRDIKPENILLAAGHARVADFGIARAFREARHDGQQITGTGVAVGTAGYMSPEQALGQPVDERVDVYGLACVTYEMLAGTPPFVAPTTGALIARHVSDLIPPLRTVRPDVSRRLERIIERALAKEPEGRFPSAEAYRRALLSQSRLPIAVTETARRVLIGGLLGAGLLVVTLFLTSGARRRSHIAITATQWTFSGNARTPALSADGSMVAYAVRRCDSIEPCTEDIVVQNVNRPNVLRVSKGFTLVTDVMWSRDGQTLLVEGVAAAGIGTYQFSALGGPARPLGGCCGGPTSAGDTVLVAKPGWILVIALPDGIVRDSVRLPAFLGPRVSAVCGLSADRIVTLASAPGNRHTLLVLNRAGRLLDSSTVSTPVPWFRIRCAPHYGGVVQSVGRRSGSRREFDLLLHRIDSSGRVTHHADTLARGLDLWLGRFDLSDDGTIAYTTNSPDTRLIAVTRRPGVPARFFSRPLRRSTGWAVGLLSPSGEQILVAETVAGGDTRLVMFPFDSGPDLPIGRLKVQDGKGDIIAYGWAASGDKVLLARERGSRTQISELHPLSGQAHDFGSIARDSFRDMLGTGPGGGVLLSVKSPLAESQAAGRCGLYRLGVPGLRDSMLISPVPQSVRRGVGGPPCGEVAVSPDGQSFAWTFIVLGGPGRDSVALYRFRLGDSRSRRVTAVPADPFGSGGGGGGGVRWSGRDSIDFIAGGEGGVAKVYRVSASGGQAVVLEALPHPRAEYSLARDGRRMVARLLDDRADLFLAKIATP